MLIKFSVFLSVFMTLVLPNLGFSQDGFPSKEELRKVVVQEGVTGWIHGKNPENGLLVFTLRNPENFFEYRLYPMLPTRKVLEVFETLNRHDKVWIKGRVIRNRAPIDHIQVREIEIVEKFIPTQKREPRTPELGKYPNRGQDLFKVHGVDEEGKFILLEKGNDLIPLFIKEENEVVKTLYRNDIIRVSFKKLSHPRRGPSHFTLDKDVENPIEVIERIVEGHGEDITLYGALVQFEKSPQIIFDIYAVRDVNELGFWRNYTLINFENAEVFEQIRLKAAEAWKQNVECRSDARNSLLNQTLQVIVRGKKNVVSKSQANPQVIIESADDLEIKVLECPTKF